jgi:hypothetical protein
MPYEANDYMRAPDSPPIPACISDAHNNKSDVSPRQAEYRKEFVTANLAIGYQQ